MFNSLVFNSEIMKILMGTYLEAFAIAAHDGKTVLSITGEDVGIFWIIF
jgi:DNA-binding ferritin-like protein (Dps family)